MDTGSLPGVVSRREAVQRGLKHYFTGKPCKHGHVARRFTSTWICTACNAAPDRRRYVSDWQRENTAKVAERNERWCDRNREKHRAANRKWIRDNPDKANAALARRRARELQATPAWADQEKIAAFYTEAARLTRETGIPHEVDHIVPLAGRNVCGLHVENNLRVVTRKANRSKGNRLPREEKCV